MSTFLKRLFGRSSKSEQKRLPGPGETPIKPFSEIATAYSYSFEPVHNKEKLFESGVYTDDSIGDYKEYLQAVRQGRRWTVRKMQEIKDSEGKDTIVMKELQQGLCFHEALYLVAVYDKKQRATLAGSQIFPEFYNAERHFIGYARLEEVLFDNQGIPHLTENGVPVTSGDFDRQEYEWLKSLREERKLAQNPLLSVSFQNQAADLAAQNSGETYKSFDKAFEWAEFETAMQQLHSNIRYALMGFVAPGKPVPGGGAKDWNSIACGEYSALGQSYPLMYYSYDPTRTGENAGAYTRSGRVVPVEGSVFHEFARRITKADNILTELLQHPLAGETVNNYLSGIKLKLALLSATWHFQQYRQVDFAYNEAELPLRQFAEDSKELLEQEMKRHGLGDHEKEMMRGFVVNTNDFRTIYNELDRLAQDYQKNLFYFSQHADVMMKQQSTSKEEDLPLFSQNRDRRPSLSDLTRPRPPQL